MDESPVFADVTYQLTGYTLLRGLEFQLSGGIGEYDLVLTLARDENARSAAITVRFVAVSHLAVQDFGGGFTQLLCLTVEDVSGQQWERIKFRVRDVERDKISFYCNAVIANPLVNEMGGMT